MTEREQITGESPETTGQQIDPLLSQRLGLTFQAHQDFAQATAMISEYPGSVYTLIDAADTAVAMGADPSSLIRSVTDFAEKSDSIREKIDLYGTVARFHAKMGNIDDAIVHLRLADAYGEQVQPHVHIDIAVAQAKVGIDPHEMLRQAKDMAGRTAVEGARGQYRVMQDAYMRILHLQGIAKAEAAIGIDPLPTFQEAIRLAGNDYYRDTAYAGIAKDLALCGYFPEAVKLAKAVTEVKDKHISFDEKGKTIWFIAKEQVVAGDIKGALTTTLETEREDVIASMYAEISLALLQSGVDDVTSTITMARIYADAIPGNQTQIEVYALIARAQAQSNKEEAEQLFSLGVKTIEAWDVDQGYDKPRAYLAIARNQARAGLDALPAFTLAIQEADQLTCYAGVNYIDEAEQSMTYENIAQDATAVGYFGIARSMVEKINPLHGDYKKNLLLDLATEEAKKGLTQAEIEALSSRDITTIISSDDETAKQAIVYFALDKKVA